MNEALNQKSLESRPPLKCQKLGVSKGGVEKSLAFNELSMKSYGKAFYQSIQCDHVGHLQVVQLENQREYQTSSITLEYSTNSLWRKVDIRFFQSQ